MNPVTRPTIIVPTLDDSDAEHLLPLAAALTAARDSDVLLLGVVTVDPGQPLSDGVVAAQRRRENLQELRARPEVGLRSSVRVARSIYEGICDVVREEQAELLLVGWRDTRVSSERLFGPPLDQLLETPPCDLAIVKYEPHRVARRILLPTNGGPNLALSRDLAIALAEATDGSVTVLCATDPQHPVDPTALARIRELEHFPRIDSILELRAPALPAILQETHEHEAVVVGATGRRFNADQPVGPLGEAVLKEPDITVIITRHKLAEDEQRAVARFEAARDTTTRVDKWFAENTFSSEEFADIERLLALKQLRGVTISLALPALNEAATIGPLIDAIKGPLFDHMPLLDEIVLIDSNSTDDTRAIAASRGIPVHIHQELLPYYGAFAGKGEALSMTAT